MEACMETYLTVDELAATVKLSQQTIRRYVLRQEIPYHKIKKAVRFRPAEIERWIDSGGADVSTDEGGELEGDLFAGVEAGETGQAEDTGTDGRVEGTGQAEGAGADERTGRKGRARV
jgi:excisionase family DNA binding protein